MQCSSSPGQSMSVRVGVKIFVLLNRFFGLAPFDMNLAVMAPKASTNTSSITLRMYQMLPTYSALSLYIICLTSIFWQRKSASEISFAANWLQFIPNAFSYMVSLYIGVRYRSLSQQILTSFYFCDQKLQDAMGVNFRKFNSKANILSYAAAFGSILMGFLLGFLTYVKTVTWENIWSFLYWAAFCVPKFSLMLVNLQFAACVYYLISREQLTKATLGSCFINEGVICTTLTSEADLLRSDNKVTPVTNKRFHNPVESQLRSCSSLREVVATLQRLMDMINAYFGKQLVMNLLSAFVCITVQLHYTIRTIRSGFQNPDSEIMVTISALLIAMHMLEILIIFACGDHAKVKWNEFITEVQRIRLQIQDEEVRGQLFDVINTMCYKKVEFHGCNLFTIDLSVITGLISSIATYLIVLVQFQINEEQTGGKGVQSVHNFAAGAGGL